MLILHNIIPHIAQNLVMDIWQNYVDNAHICVIDIAKNWMDTTQNCHGYYTTLVYLENLSYGHWTKLKHGYIKLGQGNLAKISCELCTKLCHKYCAKLNPIFCILGSEYKWWPTRQCRGLC